MAPGTYTVRLTVGGETFTQELEILKDPRSDGTLADIQEMVAMQLEVRDDITTISGMINEIEWMKKQLNDLMESLGRREGAASVRTDAEALYGKLQAVEDKILQPVRGGGGLQVLPLPQHALQQDVGTGRGPGSIGGFRPEPAAARSL